MVVIRGKEVGTEPPGGVRGCYDRGMKRMLFLLVACGVLLLQGCMVEEEPNKANFKWSTNNDMPVGAKQSKYGAPTDKYGSPVSGTTYRSKGFSDVMGHEN
jgi:hypothetical protein